MEDYNIEPYHDNQSQQDFNQEDAYFRAKKRVQKIVGFYWHLVSYILVNAFIIYVIARALGPDETIWSFEVFSTAIFWGIGLFFHFLGVFGRSFLFSKDWEDRKIAKYMEDEKKRWE